MEDVNIADFKVKLPFRMTEYPTLIESDKSTEDKEKALNKVRNKLKKFQEVMYAHNKYSMLIVLQGMQRQRLLRRLEKQKHNWKFSTGDLKERKLWDDYMACYEEAINKTSTDDAPWYAIPADDKEMSRYIVGKVILEELKKYPDMEYPELDEKVRDNIAMYRRQLETEE